jgi:nucleotidyltransferase substrate binding protein (TIGR01987 family)
LNDINTYEISDGIDIGPLISAYEQFANSLDEAKSDLEKAGSIQYFEFTFELAWKTMKRILSHRGLNLNSPKSTFREAAKEGFINNPEMWFEFLEDRNNTVHTYNRKTADAIFAKLPQFKNEMAKFLKIIKGQTVS